MWYNLFDVINMYNMIGAYNGQILVVEDDKTVYSGIKKLLELQHYSVVIAQNGMEALEK